MLLYCNKVRPLSSNIAAKIKTTGSRQDEATVGYGLETYKEREMWNKQVKIIYFSFGGSEVRQITLNWKKIFSLSAIIFSLLLIFVSTFIELTTDFFHNRQITQLSKANSQLITLLDEMSAKVEQVETKVQTLEKQDNDLRIFVDLPQIDSDVRKLGVGGNPQIAYTEMSALTENSRNNASRVKSLLDNLEQRIHVAQKSRDEIIEKYSENLNVIRHTPSIRPVINGRVTDRFGYRLDPMLDKVRPHHGLDLAAARGTPIYAAADGIICRVVQKYTPNKGYGKLVEIDHGYGIKTKYAHLYKILVKPGQKVKRHTIIGQVGDTGRSTGPHLHYEVLKEDNPVNPEIYILD